MTLLTKSTEDVFFPPAPPWKGTGRLLESLCRKALYDFSLLDGVQHLGIALSGGKDSLTLLFLLHALSGKGVPHFKLTAFHVDGTFSCGPAITTSYLSRVCFSLGVPLICKTSQRQLQELSCYPCARERRSLLFAAAKEYGINTLAFGHHRDDSVETLLMNLLHKGEFAANLPKVPMHRYGVTIIRPLLYATEHQILNFAKQEGFARTICQCPVGTKSKRRVVKHLISVLEEEFPHARRNLSHASLLYGSNKAVIPSQKESKPL